MATNPRRVKQLKAVMYSTLANQADMLGRPQGATTGDFEAARREVIAELRQRAQRNTAMTVGAKPA